MHEQFSFTEEESFTSETPPEIYIRFREIVLTIPIEFKAINELVFEINNVHWTKSNRIYQ